MLAESCPDQEAEPNIYAKDKEPAKVCYNPSASRGEDFADRSGKQDKNQHEEQGASGRNKEDGWVRSKPEPLR